MQPDKTVERYCEQCRCVTVREAADPSSECGYCSGQLKDREYGAALGRRFEIAFYKRTGINLVEPR